jgi:hypothetical protein
MVSNPQLVTEQTFHIAIVPEMLEWLLMCVDIFIKVGDLTQDGFAVGGEPMRTRVRAGACKFLDGHVVDAKMLEQEGRQHSDGTATDYCHFAV